MNKIQIIIDENNYVKSYLLVGKFLEGIEITLPCSEEEFSDKYFAYKLENDGLIFDEEYYNICLHSKKLDSLRLQREKECFSIINRGELWYRRLNEQQVVELNEWYEAWLDVTETSIIPEKPTWLI